jgi:hypothetical protein
MTPMGEKIQKDPNGRKKYKMTPMGERNTK